MFYVDNKTIHEFPAVAHREEILYWLRAHDIDPANVVAVKVVGRQIYVSEFKLDANGRPVTNTQRTEIKTRRYRVQLKQQPPELEVV